MQGKRYEFDINNRKYAYILSLGMWIVVIALGYYCSELMPITETHTLLIFARFNSFLSY